MCCWQTVPFNYFYNLSRNVLKLSPILGIVCRSFDQSDICWGMTLILSVTCFTLFKTFRELIIFSLIYSITQIIQIKATKLLSARLIALSNLMTRIQWMECVLCLLLGYSLITLDETLDTKPICLKIGSVMSVALNIQRPFRLAYRHGNENN